MKWYIDYIEKESLFARQESFEGNIDFKLNFKNGEIRNMNISVNKSVKEIKKGEDNVIS